MRRIGLDQALFASQGRHAHRSIAVDQRTQWLSQRTSDTLRPLRRHISEHQRPIGLDLTNQRFLTQALIGESERSGACDKRSIGGAPSPDTDAGRHKSARGGSH